jgi:hypothetical protein
MTLAPIPKPPAETAARVIYERLKTMTREQCAFSVT